MNSDFLVAHPYKHHAFELGAGVAQSGASLRFLTPYYRKGFGALITRLPFGVGARAKGYIHPGLRTSDVLCPISAQLQRILIGRTNPNMFRDAFDHLASEYVRKSAGRIKCLVTLQDYMPRTVAAAVEVGMKIWSDQILNQTVDATSRIARHYASLGLGIPSHDESRNISIIENAQMITVPSTYCEQAILNIGISPLRLHKIPYGAPLAVQPRNPTRVTSDFVIVARANSIRKGGHLLLTAVETWGRKWLKSLHGRQLTISILGELEPLLKEKLRNLAIPVGITVTHGNIPHSFVAKLYWSGNLFVMPTLSEGMSLACLEALSFGLPIVATPYAGIDKLENQCGFYVDDTSDSLGHGLLRAIESRDRFSEMGERGRQLVGEYYNWSRYRHSVSDLATGLVQ